MTDKIWAVFELFINILECLMYLTFPFFVLKSKVEIKKAVIMFSISFCILMFVCYSYNLFSGFQTYVALIIIALFCLFIFQGKILKKITVSILSVLITGISSVPAIFLMGVINNKETDYAFIQSNHRVAIILLAKLLSVLVMCFIIIQLRKNDDLEPKQWLIISLIFVLADSINVFLIAYTEFISIPANQQWIFLGISSGVLVISIVVFYVISSLAITNQIKFENEILRQEKIYSQRSLKDMKKNNDEIASIKHDFNNYVLIIKALINECNYDKAINECNNITEKLENLSMNVESSSNLINIIINEKVRECHLNEIDVKCNVEKDISIDNETDFLIVLTNLFDNAIEYSITLEKHNRKIEVELKIIMGFLVFKIKNFITKSVLENNAELKTTKKDIANHGIGINSVKSILSKNNGYIKFKENNNFFIAESFFLLD